jgi:hypothetical protein
MHRHLYGTLNLEVAARYISCASKAEFSRNLKINQLLLQLKEFIYISQGLMQLYCCY